MQKGNVLLSILITLVIIGGALIIYSRAIPTENKEESSLEPNNPKIIYIESDPSTESATPTSSIKPSVIPKATKTQTKIISTPAPFEDPCKNYNQSNGLAYLKINLQYVDRQDTDTIITVKPSGQCPAVIPTGETNPITKTISPGTTSWNSAGFGPGQLRVDVNYKGQGQGFDINFTSGNHNLTVDLKNPQ